MPNLTLPVVHVALATYNGRQWIEPQVETILGQEDVEVRLVVSDDGSDDGTREWLAWLAERDSRVTLLSPREGEAGVAANFLFALRHLNVRPGEFAAFADQDDLWQPRKLIEQLEFMREAHADAVSSNVLAFAPDGEGGVTKTLIRKDQPQVEWDFLFEAPGAGSTYVFSFGAWKILVEHLDRWEAEGVSVHDWFVYAVLRGAGVTWGIDPRPHVAYRQHSHNVAGAHKGFQATAKRWQLLRTGHYRRQFLLMTEVAERAALDSGREAEFVDGLLRWRALLEDRSLLGRTAVALRWQTMRRKPSEQVSLAAAGLLGVW